MSVLHNILIRDGDTHIDGWNYTERITAPRPSCLDTRAAYLKLRKMLNDDVTIIGRYIVRRVPTTKPDCYRIGEFRFTFQGALEIIEGRASLPVKEAPPLEDLPLFRKDAA